MYFKLEKGYIFFETIKRDLKRLSSFLFVKIFLSLVLMVNFCAWLLAAHIHSQINSQQMALHFTVDFGIDYYGSIRKIFILPSLGFLLFLINSLLLLILSRNKDLKYASYLLLSASLLCNIILFASLISVYFLNFK